MHVWLLHVDYLDHNCFHTQMSFDYYIVNTTPASREHIFESDRSKQQIK